MVPKYPCPKCGAALPDPVVIAARALAGWPLPLHQQMHFCPGPILVQSRA